jgi:hypothetical protein
MTRALDYDRTRRNASTPMPHDATVDLELGFALADDMGVPADAPGRRSWDSIVAEVDPTAKAEAARATLDPDTRAGLAENAAAPPGPSMRR